MHEESWTEWLDADAEFRAWVDARPADMPSPEELGADEVGA